MSDKTYALLHNFVLYSSVGLISYFITPWVLLVLALHPGVVVTSSKDDKDGN